MIGKLALNRKFYNADQKPSIVIGNGKINREELRKNNINATFLLSLLILKNYPRLSEVEYAFIEPNGQLSVIPRSQERPVKPKDLKIDTKSENTKKGKKTIKECIIMITMATQKNQKCIDACSRCSQACYECFQACLNEPDLNARKNCISMLIECAMMCQMSVSMMSMNGKYSAEHCALCAKICDDCEKECNMFKDEHCQRCADECRSCSEECSNMAQ